MSILIACYVALQVISSFRKFGVRLRICHLSRGFGGVRFLGGRGGCGCERFRDEVFRGLCRLKSVI